VSGWRVKRERVWSELKNSELVIIVKTILADFGVKTGDCQNIFECADTNRNENDERASHFGVFVG
jgi:hypothetical protein